MDHSSAAAVDHANSLALVEEGGCDGTAGWAGAEHDVRVGGHDVTGFGGTKAPM
jgi:hypothetical protein